MSFWKKEHREARLRELWLTHDAMTLGRILGTSGDAVNTKARRMELPFKKDRNSWRTNRLEKRLRQLWSLYDGSVIGKLLGKSRCAVNAKARRMGLPRKRNRFCFVSHRQNDRAPEARVPVKENETLYDMEKTGCRWPIGDPRHKGFHFCGKDADGTYCESHARRAVQPRQVGYAK